ncbi:MAG TPA: hypothetical protein VIE65_12950 [Methylobacter sp.]
MTQDKNMKQSVTKIFLPNPEALSAGYEALKCSPHEYSAIKFRKNTMTKKFIAYMQRDWESTWCLFSIIFLGLTYNVPAFAGLGFYAGICGALCGTYFIFHDLFVSRYFFALSLILPIALVIYSVKAILLH